MSDAPGWDAIDAALWQLYEAEPVFHVAPTVYRDLGGPIAMYGLSGYRAENPPHLHLVTYGLSELYEKESETPDVSGWGIELTFRVAGDWTGERPDWAINILARMANQVDETRVPFRPGYRIDAGGPLGPGARTTVTALAVTADPQLGEIETVHGRVQFLQVVGLTSDELALARRWRTSGILEALAERDPLLITDPNRSSILDDPATRERLEERARAEGLSV